MFSSPRYFSERDSSTSLHTQQTPDWCFARRGLIVPRRLGVPHSPKISQPKESTSKRSISYRLQVWGGIVKNRPFPPSSWSATYVPLGSLLKEPQRKGSSRGGIPRRRRDWGGGVPEPPQGGGAGEHYRQQSSRQDGLRPDFAGRSIG